jgi:hypothetical protein
MIYFEKKKKLSSLKISKNIQIKNPAAGLNPFSWVSSSWVRP